jgi:hypothetical protein
MVVGNLDVEWTVMILRPLKTHTPLSIDSDAELPIPITAQCLKPVAGKHHQIVPGYRRLQNVQTPFRLLLEGLKLLHPLAGRESFSSLVAKLGRNVWRSQDSHALLWQK